MTGEKTGTFTSSELEALMDTAVKKSLKSLGVDTDNPMEMQRDFQHLRDWRTSMTTIRNKGIIAIAITAISGSLALLWLGLSTYLKG